MPVYEYAPIDTEKHAPTCNYTGRFEISQRMSDATLTACPACGVAVRKLISNTSFALKGTGWYASDYKSSGATGAATPPASAAPATAPAAAEKKDAPSPAPAATPAPSSSGPSST